MYLPFHPLNPTENDFIYRVVVREVQNEIPVHAQHGYQNPDVGDTMYHHKIMELAEMESTDSHSSGSDPKAIEGMVIEAKPETKKNEGS